MNSETIDSIQHSEINIDQSYFFKVELFLWCFFCISFLLNWLGLSTRFPFVEVLLQVSVILLAFYGSLVPFVKTRYNLEDLGSAMFNISGILLLTTGATASAIYKLPWGEDVFMVGFFCTCYYHIYCPFREKTYQNINEIEFRLVSFFVIGCLLSFPACFIHEELFPYPFPIFLYASGLGFWLLAYVLLSFFVHWYKGAVSNYMLLSYTPRILIMLYFAKGYEQFWVIAAWI